MDSEIFNRVRAEVKARGTTQASFVEACIQFALDNADMDSFNLVTARKRGRKKGSTTAKTYPAPFADDDDMTDVDTPTEAFLGDNSEPVSEATT